MDKIIISRSDNKNKKYKAVIYDVNDIKLKTFHFGARGYSDYTQHKDPKRKENYIKRHEKNEDWSSVNPGSLSRFILWEHKMLNAAAKNFSKLFGVKVLLDIN